MSTIHCAHTLVSWLAKASQHLVDALLKGARPCPSGRARLLNSATPGQPLSSTPSRRGARPKWTWRRTQADVAPNPNPCQLFPIAAHCHFEPFQRLGRHRKRHSALAPCRRQKTHATAGLFRQFSLRPSSWRPSASLFGGLSFRLAKVYRGHLDLAKERTEKICPFLPAFVLRPPPWPLPAARRQTKGMHIPGNPRVLTCESALRQASSKPLKARSLKPTNNAPRATWTGGAELVDVSRNSAGTIL
jgi:hypothetical protein